jgi:chemotaxis protein histidine kinase CheA
LKAHHFWPVGLALACLLLAGLACSETLPTGQSLPRTPSPSPTPTRPALNPTLQPTAEAIALERYGTQSAMELAAIEAQAQATAEAARVQATLTALAAQREAQRDAATLQAAEATARAEQTRQAIQATREAQAWSATATAQERDYRATATRQAWEGEQTQQAFEATKAAEATAGALAFQATATRQAWEGHQTATAESVQATQQAYQATATRQAQQRDEVLAYGRDYGIPVVLLVVVIGIGALVVYGIRQHARRPMVIQRDLRGDAPPLALPAADGGWNLVDLDRQPGHVTRLLTSGDTLAPQFRSAGQEERTTARDQLVDATTRPRLGASKGSNRQAPTLPVTPPPQAPAPGLRSVRVLRRLDQAGTAGFLPGPLLASLQADWEEER